MTRALSTFHPASASPTHFLILKLKPRLENSCQSQHLPHLQNPLWPVQVRLWGRYQIWQYTDRTYCMKYWWRLGLQSNRTETHFVAWKQLLTNTSTLRSCINSPFAMMVFTLRALLPEQLQNASWVLSGNSCKYNTAALREQGCALFQQCAKLETRAHKKFCAGDVIYS